MNNDFLLGEKYRLDIKWTQTNYDEGVCRFTDAYMSGPVLSFAEKIEPNTSMELDFFKQYFVLVDNVYIGTLAWADVTYVKNKVYLSDCTLTHTSELHKVPKLQAKDMLVVDCKLHEREDHPFNPTYKTYVSNSDTQVYNFSM